MTSTQLQKIANGLTINPGIVTLARVAKAMGLTLAELIEEKGEDEQIAVFKSSPAELIEQGRPSSLEGDEVQAMPSSAVQHGQSCAVSLDLLDTTRRAMQDATAALRIAIDHHIAATAKAVEDAGRQTAAPRPRVARKHPGPRKNRG